jgi:hypothetical protein
MAHFSRYSGLARQDLFFNELGIPWVLQGERPPKTTVKLWGRSNDRFKSYGPFQLLFRSGATRPPLQRVRDSIGTSRKTSFGNYYKTLSVVQRSDQKLWPFSVVISVRRDRTSSLTRRDSLDTSRKTGCRNYCNYLSAIQRSDKKLWPFSAVILVWREKTSSSSSRDSIGTSRKTGSGNYCKTLSSIKRSDQNI